MAHYPKIICVTTSYLGHWRTILIYFLYFVMKRYVIRITLGHSNRLWQPVFQGFVTVSHIIVNPSYVISSLSTIFFPLYLVGLISGQVGICSDKLILCSLVHGQAKFFVISTTLV